MDLFRMLAADKAARRKTLVSAGGLFGEPEPLEEPETGMWETTPDLGNVDDYGWPEAARRARCTPLVMARRTPKGGEFRPACLGCGWVGERSWIDAQVHQTRYVDPRGPVSRMAIEAAHDHTHPGWRELVVLDRPKWPNGYATAGDVRAWGRRIERLYPEGWFAAGGPVLTRRTGLWEMDARPAGAPGGGWELGWLTVRENRKPPAQAVHLLAPYRGRYSYAAEGLIYDPETGDAMDGYRLRQRQEQRANAHRRYVVLRRGAEGAEALTADEGWTRAKDQARLFSHDERTAGWQGPVPYPFLREHEAEWVEVTNHVEAELPVVEEDDDEEAYDEDWYASDDEYDEDEAEDPGGRPVVDVAVGPALAETGEAGDAA